MSIYWVRIHSALRPVLNEPASALRERSPACVEVPGIEPGSSVAFPGLLRAQFTVPLLGPTGHVNKPV